MQEKEISNYLQSVLKNMPEGWTKTTTHRLDIYNEKLAKTEFLTAFEKLFENNISQTTALNKLPTAYDYIRLGHPLSCILEWAIGKKQSLPAENIICFSSQTMPILAILRKNALENKKTQIVYTDSLPNSFDAEIVNSIYEYSFELKQISNTETIPEFDGSTIFIHNSDKISAIQIASDIDFLISNFSELGSILYVNGAKNNHYISKIQHLRRRETIAMTPINCLAALHIFLKNSDFKLQKTNRDYDKNKVLQTIKTITGTSLQPIVGSSGLSVQYAIMMGLIHYAKINHPKKAIKFIVPPNCYGGTNDQARRVAAVIKNVTIVDLPVDGKNDMVQSLEKILNQVALDDAIPYIIAEIPTNPRVEVPDLEDLKAVLSKTRKTKSGDIAVDSVFILDQTFCPNVLFLGKNKILSEVKAISYASGSKFPSGGKCTSGYVVGNDKTADLMQKIESHLLLCENEATDLQYQILAEQLPSMNQRIADAYKNTREFVDYIHEVLPTAKINFVSEELANQEFTPSVFSLDLPTKGATNQEKENYKREMNHKLIDLMITKIPTESKYCVSYGQLKGCYWTIPATSTQGTTKEGDKDYIARVALSANMDLKRHKEVFLEFVKSM